MVLHPVLSLELIDHSSNLLESIQQYNVLFQYLLDFSCDQSFKGGATSWGCTTDRNGYLLPKSGATVSTQATFCIPIVSGIFGTLCEKNLPLGLMGNDMKAITDKSVEC